MALEEDLNRCSREDLKALIRTLMRQVEQLEERIKEQDRRIDELEARLNESPKNSGNSSMPPSKGFKGNKGKDTCKSERTGPRQALFRQGNRGHSETPARRARDLFRRNERADRHLLRP